MTYFNETWNDFPDWRKRMKRDCKQLFDECLEIYEASQQTSTSTAADEPTYETRSSQSQPYPPPHTETSKTSKNPHKRRFQDFGKPNSTPPPGVKRPRLQNEWERWIVTRPDGVAVSDPIAWWAERRAEYPVLSKIAMDIFSIPAMSAEPERIFSQLKRIVTADRNSLGDDVIEAIECQKHWLNGLFKAQSSPPREERATTTSQHQNNR